MAQQKKRSPVKTTRVKQPRTLIRSSAESRLPINGVLGWLAGGVALGLLVAFLMWNVNSSKPQDAVPVSVVNAPDYHALLIDAEDAEDVLFGSHSGVQHSSDGGRTWSQGSLLNVDAMILDSSHVDPDRIYAAGHDVFQVSRDRGETWQQVAHNLPGTDIHGFAQNPEDPGRLYAFVVGFGGWTSGDDGATWKAFGSQPQGSGALLVLASNGMALYAATDAGISRSYDHGASWDLLKNQPGKMTFFGLAVSAENPDTIYAATPVGVARSTNQGESWTMLASPNVMALAVAVSPTDERLLMVLDDEGRIYRSADGGTSWESPTDENI